MKLFKTKNGTCTNLVIEKTLFGFKLFKATSKILSRDKRVKTKRKETLYHGKSMAEAVHIAKKIIKDLEDMGL